MKWVFREKGVTLVPLELLVLEVKQVLKAPLDFRDPLD